MIKFFNVDRQYSADREIYLNIFDQVCSSGQVVGGENTQRLENHLRAKFNRKHAVVLNSCTDCLGFVGEYLLNKYQNETISVYFPLMSFLATNSGFLREIDQTQIDLHYIDVDYNCNIDLDKLEETVSHDKNSIKILVWVNLFGNPVDYDRLKQLESFYNLHLVEDAAQSIGASWNGVRSGSMGEASCFSFDPTKNLNAFGIGGAVLTDDDHLATRARTRSRPNSQTWSSAGFNSQINEVDAAIIDYKLQHRFNAWQQRRTDIAEHYIKTFGNLVYTIEQKKEAVCSWHKFIIKHRDRDLLKDRLKQNGIETRIHYPYLLQENPNSKAYKLSQMLLSLPIYPELTDQEVEFVADTAKRLV